jgi:hypothetical protein
MKNTIRIGLASALVIGALGIAPEAPADAPAGRYTIASGVVTDNFTKLHWQQAVGSTGMTWSEATSYCQSLNWNGTGWRLPSMKELQTIVDKTKHGPAIDTTAFPSTPSSGFWSSSPVAGNYDDAWYVNFNVGVTDYSVVDFNNAVRCVR